MEFWNVGTSPPQTRDHKEAVNDRGSTRPTLPTWFNDIFNDIFHAWKCSINPTTTAIFNLFSVFYGACGAERPGRPCSTPFSWRSSASGTFLSHCSCFNSQIPWCYKRPSPRFANGTAGSKWCLAVSMSGCVGKNPVWNWLILIISKSSNFWTATLATYLAPSGALPHLL